MDVGCFGPFEVLYQTGAKKPRRNISDVVAGCAITEDDIFEKVKNYKESVNPKTGNKKRQLKGKSALIPKDNPKAGSSGLNNVFSEDLSRVRRRQ